MKPLCVHCINAVGRRPQNLFFVEADNVTHVTNRHAPSNLKDVFYVFPEPCRVPIKLLIEAGFAFRTWFGTRIKSGDIEMDASTLISRQLGRAAQRVELVVDEAAQPA